MISRTSSIRPTILTIAALAAVLQTGSRHVAADGGDDQLKWTPHRASTARADFDPAEGGPLAATDTGPDDVALSGPPASVALPDDVPVASPPPRMVRTVSAPRASRPAPARPAEGGFMNRVYDPRNPDALFGVRVIRTPQPPAKAARSIADTQARGPRPASGDTRLGGGLAPRYPTDDADAARQRPERLAMNVDGIPSVMTQAPQVGGLDDAAVPGRMPVGAGGRDRLPTPAADPATPPRAADSYQQDVESIGPGIQLPDDGYGYDMPGDEFNDGMGGMDGMDGMDGDDGYGGDGGLLMGEYPTQLHVESFYDDPYACDDEGELLPMCSHHGRICNWLRQFGRPYYGWQWYRDFTASAGITSFTNATDLGVHGNFGTNEYLNWSMPFWNAFGTGWQLGWRGVQSNFQPTSLQIGGTTLDKNARDQQFITTGFFTRAFEGRGLQGGIVYDYLHDNWFENTDLAQLRYELSYVWGYHELGFWGASNVADQLGIFGRRVPTQGVADTLAIYTGFYRVQFGDANELKVWGGGTDEADGIVGALVRAPLHRSLALESTFNYVIPGRNHTVTLAEGADSVTFAPSAWNLSLNVVWYPAARSRRSLASPYRPLFEVADNGSMIRSIEGLLRP